MAIKQRPDSNSIEKQIGGKNSSWRYALICVKNTKNGIYFGFNVCREEYDVAPCTATLDLEFPEVLVQPIDRQTYQV
jgi:hypothetical protein